MTNQIDNKRIAKNTLLLYLRMLLTMVVSLYTSRVVLNTLGVEDYGIYNVVGGIVTMFAFLNSAMLTSTQRYITFELGKGDTVRLAQVFATSMQIHCIISVVIVVLTETIGLWFFYNKMVIPPDRTTAAMIVLQLSVITMVIQVMSVPYNSTIVAHEDMGVFAAISILEVMLKLAVVFLLLNWNYDKLIIYAVLIAIVQLIIRIIYSVYCTKNYAETRSTRVFDKALLFEMGKFAGWNLWGNIASVLGGQGINMLLNVFFGPAVNAARAITVQVQGVIRQLTSNFQMALNPQITKKYAASDYNNMFLLIFRSSKFSYYLMFLICLPILIEASFILKLWLKNVPDYTVIFLRLAIIGMLIEGTSNPIMTAAAATGRIKTYQMVVGGIYLLVLPFSYVALKNGLAPWSVYVVDIFISVFAYTSRLYIVSGLIKLSIFEYFRTVIVRVFIVTIFSLIVPLIFVLGFYENTLIHHFMMIVICIISAVICALYLGLERHERDVIYNYVIQHWKKGIFIK